MQVRFAVASVLSLSAMFIPAVAAMSQEIAGRQPTTPTTVTVSDSTENKFLFLLFWKENTPAARKIAATLQTAVEKRSDRAAWTEINAADPANQGLVERYKVSRSPMPLVLCVAPNGAITGAFQKAISDEAVEKSIVTPTMTECMKALQSGKIVVVHVKVDPNESLPVGAQDFLADPSFQARSTTVSFVVDDPAEARFLNDMEINPTAMKGSIISVLAPPGVLVGKYSAATSKNQIAADLHAAGKCCNDPNCKHNQKAK